MRVQLQPGYILHTQAYSNTSLLVDIFSRDYGRLRLVAKGVRSAKSSRRALLQAFIPLKLGWSGRSELKTLSDIELNTEKNLVKLATDALFNGLYVNELLLKLTCEHDPHHDVFGLYADTIQGLGEGVEQEFCLRYFEYQLLEYLGYGLAPGNIYDNEEQWLQYKPDCGFISHQGSHSALPLVQVKYLVAIAQKKKCDKNGMQQLKSLMRFALHYHLDGKKIQSRALYQ